MADSSITSATVSLAGRAAELAMDLSSIHRRCGRSNTSSDILSIASKLTILSTTLWRLHDAMQVEPESYTVFFNQDLAEILRELEMVIDEISECCTELQKPDKPTSVVIWLFEKSKVQHLQKHRTALKTTLLVMRTVLWHGKEAVQRSPDHPCELVYGPHAMHEDRLIIESVLSQNRDAILDLQNFDPINNVQCQRSPGKGTNGCRHDHIYSSRIELPPISDSLLAVAIAKSPSPGRCFSKCGARLEVYVFTLDLGAHDASNRLKDKWMQTSRSHQHLPRKEKHRTSFSGGHVLSKISEAESYKVRSLLKDVSKMAIPFSPEKEDKTEISESRSGHLRSLSQVIMAGPGGKGLHIIKNATEEVKPWGGCRSLAQEDLEIEIENYGSA